MAIRSLNGFTPNHILRGLGMDQRTGNSEIGGQSQKLSPCW